MTASKNQNAETKAASVRGELPETELNQTSGGIIVVCKNAQMADGSVAPAPMTTQSQRGIISI